MVGAYLLLRRSGLRVTLREFGVLFGLRGAVRFHVAAVTIAYLYIPSRGRHDDPFHCIRCWSPRSWRCFQRPDFGVRDGRALAAVAGDVAAFGRTGCRGRDEGADTGARDRSSCAVYIVGVNKSCVQRMKGLKMVFFILLSATIIFAGNLFVKKFRIHSDWSAAVHLILLALIPLWYPI